VVPPSNDNHQSDEYRSFDMLYNMVQELRDDVGDIKRKLSERDGERRVISWLTTAVSALVGTVAGAGMEFLRHRQ